ncbi:hypothetical protein ACFQJ7_08450 [Halovenus rubra]|uniref:Uncharacterized protein n=2 Tax=Halovenus rubra TaxID=869890 RepID=A0ACC7E4V5_9EURY|nr:hypothetical protein [Halovenus rubra]
MSHDCEDCGQEFETLSRLRLHDCPADEPAENDDSEKSETSASDRNVAERQSDEVTIKQLDELLASIHDGELSAIHQAMAMYETQLRSAHESGEPDRYRSISRAYREQLITVLDEATQTEGWEFLEEFLDAYHPETADEFPHVTTILQNVTSRYLIRTRLSDGVEAIPVEALGFFSSILTRLDGSGYDFITEGMHPYGWGIGHPEHSVADNIHDYASTSIPIVNAILEHAFYADQRSAIELLEQIVEDESIQEIMRHPSGEISETRYLLDAPAGVVADFTPTIPRYWEWQEELDYEFELADDVEQRIRKLVRQKRIDDDLPSNWEIADLTV